MKSALCNFEDYSLYSRSMQHRTAKTSFTLIELLIVIAIIAILAGLFLPALKKVQEKAKEIKCSGQLRQLNLYTLGYAMDWNGYNPPYQNLSMASVSSSYWFCYLWAYINPHYTSIWLSPKLLLCPSLIPPRGYYPDYGANGNLFMFIAADGTLWTNGYGQGSIIKLSQLHGNLSKTLFYTEVNGHLGIGTLGNTDPNPANCRVHYRHNTGLNVLFVDGHVSWMRSPAYWGTYLDIAHTGTMWLYEK